MRRQKNTYQMKEQNKTPEKELNEMEIANLSDAKFKTLVIRMFKELIEYSNNRYEEMKVTLSEIKKNLQGRKERKSAIQINNLEHKEEISIQLEQKEETRIQKKEDSIRRIWDISKHAHYRDGRRRRGRARN